MDLIQTIAGEVWGTLCEMAPYLLLGFFVAALLSVVMSPRLIEKHLGRKGKASVFKAALFGVPLPLCSCGVIPVAASLRQHGASKGATTAFLLSTPQTGVDSIMVTFSLLGPIFAVFRPLAALITGFLGGIIVDSSDKEENDVLNQANSSSSVPDRKNWREGLVYGFYTLPRDIGKQLLIGLLIAGIISALIPDNFFIDTIGTGIPAMLLMMLVGIPVYVCATGSVPVAVAMMAKGISPGAALVFLMTGPATNAAAIATLWKILGRRTAVIYLAIVAVVALASGILMDLIFSIHQIDTMHTAHVMFPGWINVSAAWILLTVLAFALLKKPAKHKHRHNANNKKTELLSVKGMTCSCCAESISRALREVHGITSAVVSLEDGSVVIKGDSYDIDAAKKAVTSLGYKIKS